MIENKVVFADRKKANVLIKKYLKETFGIEKAKVRYNTFSGGDSYDIVWQYGPQAYETEKKLFCLKDGNKPVVIDGLAIPRARFVSCSRDIEKDVVEIVALYIAQNTPIHDVDDAEMTIETTNDLLKRFEANVTLPYRYGHTTYFEFARIMLENCNYPFYAVKNLEIIDLPAYDPCEKIFTMKVSADDKEFEIKHTF